MLGLWLCVDILRVESKNMKLFFLSARTLAIVQSGFSSLLAFENLCAKP